MGRYRIRVATGAWLFSGSHNCVRLWLVGERGEAELELQLRPVRGEVSLRERGPGPLARRVPEAGKGQETGGQRQRDRSRWLGVLRS